MMALLKWLLKKESNKESVLSEDASPAAHAKKPSSRREIRAGRRELLFNVITHVMDTMGMTSPSYKFKVLTLDGDGKQHLAMVDMARDLMRDTGRLEEIEFQVIQQAKQKHDLVVTTMYFRVNESLTPRTKPSPPPAARSRSPLRPARAPARPLRPLRPTTAGAEDNASTAFPPTAVALPHQSVMPSNESSSVGKGRSFLQSLKLSGGSLAASWRNRRAEAKKGERNFATTTVEDSIHAATSDSKRST